MRAPDECMVSDLFCVTEYYSRSELHVRSHAWPTGLLSDLWVGSRIGYHIHVVLHKLEDVYLRYPEIY